MPTKTNDGKAKSLSEASCRYHTQPCGKETGEKIGGKIDGGRRPSAILNKIQGFVAEGRKRGKAAKKPACNQQSPMVRQQQFFCCEDHKQPDDIAPYNVNNQSSVGKINTKATSCPKRGQISGYRANTAANGDKQYTFQLIRSSRTVGH